MIYQRHISGLLTASVLLGSLFAAGMKPRRAIALRRTNQAEKAGFPAKSAESVSHVQSKEHDFGLVELASVYKVVLVIPNPSGRAIHIRKVRSECRCMTAKALKGSLGPDEPIKVLVTLTAPKRPIRYNMRALIVTDDRKHPIIPIRIKADVGLPLVVEALRFGSQATVTSDRPQAYADILNRSKKPMRVSDHRSAAGRAP